jgi:hypothetical protein
MQIGLRAHALLVDDGAAREAVEPVAAAYGCGSSRAIRCAKHQPAAGVALKPP